MHLYLHTYSLYKIISVVIIAAIYFIKKAAAISVSIVSFSLSMSLYIWRFIVQPQGEDRYVGLRWGGGGIDVRCCNIIMQRESCLLVMGPRGESEGTTPCSIAQRSAPPTFPRSIDLRGQPGPPRVRALRPTRPNWTPILPPLPSTSLFYPIRLLGAALPPRFDTKIKNAHDFVSCIIYF